METIQKSVITLTVVINCHYEKAWQYLTDPMNQKEWGVHFFEDITLEEDTYWATVPFGKVPLMLLTDKASGVIDIKLGEGEPMRTRLVGHGENVSYIFTLVKPEAMPDKVFDEVGVPNMKEELEILKNILENH